MRHRTFGEWANFVMSFICMAAALYQVDTSKHRSLVLAICAIWILMWEPL